MAKGKGKNRKRIIPSQKQPSPQVLQTSRSTLDDPLTLSFKHYSEGSDYCLGKCDMDTVRRAMKALRQVTTLAFKDVLRTGGRPGNKGGLGYTPYSDDDINVARPQAIDRSSQIAAFRFSQVGRIWGVHDRGIFFVLWFDPYHQIWKG